MAQRWARLCSLVVDAAEAVMPSGISQRERDSHRARLVPESGPITAPPIALPVVILEGGPSSSVFSESEKIARV